MSFYNDANLMDKYRDKKSLLKEDYTNSILGFEAKCSLSEFPANSLSRKKSFPCG